MNGLQLEGVLALIDCNIHSNMDFVRSEVVAFLRDHSDDLAHQIADNGYGIIPTQIGEIKVSREDLEVTYA